MARWPAPAPLSSTKDEEQPALRWGQIGDRSAAQALCSGGNTEPKDKQLTTAATKLQSHARRKQAAKEVEALRAAKAEEEKADAALADAKAKEEAATLAEKEVSP